MKKIRILFSALLIALSLCGCVSEAKTTAPSIDEMEVHFIDVGQGDATLIKFGDSAMLIDAGENDKGTLVQNYIKKQGVTSLDYLIVTHPDSDHCGGADVIVTKYDIDTVIMPNYEKDTATYRDVINALDDKQYRVTEPIVGDTYKLGDAKFTIIAPNSDDYADECNNYSVGILLEHGDKKFVFTGDAEEEAERDIVDNKIDISADVLQVGHHGSKTSSIKDFIEAVNPEYAVISCEENNDYGHPNAAALNTLRANNVKVFRTDEQGSLVAISNGKEITWNAAPTDTWKAGEATKSNTKSDTESEIKPNTKSDTESEIKSDAKSENNYNSTDTAKNAVPEVSLDDKSQTVHITRTGKKYHNEGCSSLSKSDIEVTLGEAVSKGLGACEKCH